MMPFMFEVINNFEEREGLNVGSSHLGQLNADSVSSLTFSNWLFM